MSKKNREEEKVIMQHILEVRLKKRLFSFTDFSGKMVDFMIKKLGVEQIRLNGNGSRFDLATNNLEYLYFFSFENFGFQAEMQDSFEDFSDKVKEFISALEEFPDYRWSDGLVRIGTKSTILYHRKFDNFSTIKQAYKDLLVNDHQKISELTKSTILDTAYTFDLERETCKANVTTGPVTRDEAISRFFGGKKEYENKFNKDNGMLLTIDVSGNKTTDISDLKQLEVQISVQINDIKEIFNGFKTYFANNNES